jgi:ActR/RegA family two-component response regulator
VRERTAELPFIVMTAHGSIATAVEAIRLGAHQYLTKPVDFKAFEEKIRQLNFYWILINEPPVLEE